MNIRHTLATALAAGTVLALSGCGSSFDDSRDLYEQLRVEVGCDTVDSDDFESFMDGEVADGIPAFDVVEGECKNGDDDISIAAVAIHDAKGSEFLEAMGAEDAEGYAVQSSKWVVMIDGTDEEDLAFAETAKDALGGTVVAFSANGVNKI